MLNLTYAKNKNILIIGANSDIARSLIKYLFSFNVNIFATYRKDIPETLDNFLPLFLDICDEDSYLEFKKISRILNLMRL